MTVASSPAGLPTGTYHVAAGAGIGSAACRSQIYDMRWTGDRT